MDDLDKMQMIVKQLRWEAKGVVSLVLERPDGRPLPAWSAGAHLDLQLPTGLVRQYSLCGQPGDATSYKVAILRDPASRGGSEYVHMLLRPGQSVSVGTPRNHFELVPARHYWLIAGGIGVTPILALAQELKGAGNWSVLYLGRGADSFPFREELQALGGEVEIHDSLEKGRKNLADFLGEVGAEDAVYICGSEALLDAVEAVGDAWPKGVLHLERFKPRLKAPSDPTAFDVVWVPTKKTLTVPPNRSVLDVLEDAGLPVGGSCKEGVCGSCEVLVSAGSPEHRDDVIEEHATASGERFFPCVSRAHSDVLELQGS